MEMYDSIYSIWIWSMASGYSGGLGQMTDLKFTRFHTCISWCPGSELCIIPKKVIPLTLFSIELFYRLSFSLCHKHLNTAHQFLGYRCGCGNLLHSPEGSIPFCSNPRYPRCLYRHGASYVFWSCPVRSQSIPSLTFFTQFPPLLLHYSYTPSGTTRSHYVTQTPHFPNTNNTADCCI